MKSSRLLQFLVVASLFLYSNSVYSQVTIQLVNPVCNHDGVLVVQNPFFPTFGCYYYWYTNNGQVIHYSTSQYDSLTNFSGGYVSVECIPANGMGPFYDFNYFDYPFGIIPTAVADSCPQQNGSLTLAVLGGLAPYTYSWFFNGMPFPGITNAITNLSGGYYDCLITDMNGCQMMLSDLDSIDNGYYVPSINDIVLNTSTTPANCTNGTATVVASGGNMPYSYFWSNGQTTSTATGLIANSIYNVSVTDMDGCVSYSGAYMLSTVSVNAFTSVTNANCDDLDGAITAIGSGGTGPYTYLWNTFATTPTITNLPSGNYVVTVTDAQGCLGTSYPNVASISPVNVNYSVTPSQCLGATGTITPNVTGGTPPYNYQWFSSPVQTTPIASGLAAGLYNFVITDSQGCIRTGTASVSQNTNLYMTMNSTANLCLNNDGTAEMISSGGVTPYTFSWSSGQSTATISGMPSANVYGTVTDADGCFMTNCVHIPYISNLNMMVVPQIASCVYTADGSASVNIISGSAPYQYDWSTGATTPTISGLLPGYYSVNITDANGCLAAQSFYIGYNTIAPCSGTIQGSVFIDLNNNCQKDPGEPVMANIPIKCVTTGDIDYTNASGFYSFVVPPGVTTIQQLPMPYRYQVCPATNPFTVNVSGPGAIVIQDIADTVDWVTDLSVEMYNYSSPPVVGKDFVQRIVEFNRGTIALSSTAQYDYDSQAPFLFSGPATPTALNVPAASATYFNSISLPLASRQYNVTHTIPVNVPIGTMLNYTDTIFPIIGDTAWWDNTDFKQLMTLGSYDPNYKEVFPAGIGPQGYISASDSVLQYIIHFQNLGNYYAENIILLDSLDSDLDWNSMRVEYATHDQTASISPTGLLQFTFSNINLPSVSQNELLSNGFVAFTIKLKPNLPDGTQITNAADVYFDFNAPVRTNTTLNTIQLTGIHPESVSDAFSIYPNPNNGSFTLQFDEPVAEDLEIQLFNITGQQVYNNRLTSTGTGSIALEIRDLPTGVYTVRCTGKHRVNTAMVVIE